MTHLLGRCSAKSFMETDLLFCCDTFETCDWGACINCQRKEAAFTGVAQDIGSDTEQDLEAGAGPQAFDIVDNPLADLSVDSDVLLAGVIASSDIGKASGKSKAKLTKKQAKKAAKAKKGAKAANEDAIGGPPRSFEMEDFGSSRSFEVEEAGSPRSPTFEMEGTDNDHDEPELVDNPLAVGGSFEVETVELASQDRSKSKKDKKKKQGKKKQGNKKGASPTRPDQSAAATFEVDGQEDESYSNPLAAGTASATSFDSLPVGGAFEVETVEPATKDKKKGNKKKGNKKKDKKQAASEPELDQSATLDVGSQEDSFSNPLAAGTASTSSIDPSAFDAEGDDT